MYQFEIYIKNEKTTPSIITIEKDFEKEFQAKRELSDIGINGLIYNGIYYPPHRISEIMFKKL